MHGSDKVAEYVVIEDCGEFAYCLDKGNASNGECPIIAWDRAAGFNGKRATDFYEFFSESSKTRKKAGMRSSAR
ncbi:SMI1/KNR4 family protein [Gorillibacterium sp. CAU 1737]|uniref:SMI1/KNR4 family protein n=1 Tax=Gorillibacterium sp. CAU 1737 TaxID=3140362 RepID=UPI0032607190